VLFVLFTFGIVLQLLLFLMPFVLHRKTLNQMASTDLNKLTSLDRLLESPEFLAGFSAFLQKEFSSENLYFWQEVNKLQHKYRVLLPTVMGPDDSHRTSVAWTPVNETGLETLAQAAEDCCMLGRQYIGEQAITQVNISGFTGQEIGMAIRKVAELVSQKSQESELRPVVEEALKALVAARREIYQGLKKDSYARFLMTPAARELNKNEHLKRLLAAEKLAGEVLTTAESSGSGLTDGSASNKRLSEATHGRSQTLGQNSVS